MKIEEALQQSKPFKSLLEKSIVNILYTGNIVKEKNESYFKEFGLTTKQYNILRILNGSSRDLSTSQIRARMLDKMSDASRLVDRLEKKGLIKKAKNDADHRLVVVTLTKKGKNLLAKINPSKSLNFFGGELNDKELNKLNELLDKFRGE